MLALTVCVALVTPLGASSRQAEEPSIEQEIEALVAKTNALESLHLVYELDSGEAHPDGEMEIVYRAPDLGHVRVHRKEGPVDAWWIGNSIYVDGGDGWRHASAELPEASRVLDELFPGKRKPLDPGVMLRLSFGEKGIDPSFAWMPNGRSCVLGWFDAMRRVEVAREANVLSWQAGGGRYQVSRQSGLLECVEADVGTKHVTLRLKSAAMDVALDADLTTLPDEARKGEPDPEMLRGFSSVYWMVLRDTAYARASTREPWDQRARDDWRTLLQSLHREPMETKREAELQRIEDRLDQLIDRWRSALQQDDSPGARTKVEKEIAEARAELEGLLERNEKSGIDSLPPVRAPQDERLDELAALEREVVASIWTELYREPALRSFEEKAASVHAR